LNEAERARVKPWRHTFLTNGVLFASGLASGIIAARLLGAEDRGLLAAITYWPHFIAGMAAMGINEAITIRTARRGTTGTLRATTLWLSLALALPVIAIGVLLIHLLLGPSRQDSLAFTQIYCAVFVPLTFLATNFLAVEHGEFNYRTFNLQRIILSATYPSLLIGLWMVDRLTVQSAAIAVLSGTALVALIRLWQVRARLNVRPSLREARELLAQGWRLHAANLVMHLAMQLDKLALVLFSSNLQLGLYVVASTAANAAQSLAVQTYNNVMLPAAAKERGARRDIALIVGTLRKLVALLVIATVVLVVAMPFLLPVVFGAEFSAAVPYAQLLAVAFAFMGVKNAVIYLLRAWEINRPAIAAEGLASLILLAGAYPVVRAWDAFGLAVLVLIAQALSTALLGGWFVKYTKVSVRQLVGNWSAAGHGRRRQRP